MVYHSPSGVLIFYAHWKTLMFFQTFEKELTYIVICFLHVGITDLLKLFLIHLIENNQTYTFFYRTWGWTPAILFVFITLISGVSPEQNRDFQCGTKVIHISSPHVLLIWSQQNLHISFLQDMKLGTWYFIIPSPTKLRWDIVTLPSILP
jgi:hypothetical protein